MFRASFSGARMKKPVIRFIQVGAIIHDWGGGRVKRNEHIGESLDGSVALNSPSASHILGLRCLSQ